MSLQTKILTVKNDSVHFANGVTSFSDETTEKHIRLASIAVKESGQVVAFPTETVYGLGGSAFDDKSVKAIYAAKNRPADNPLIVHVSSIEQASRLILPQSHKIPSIYDKLLAKFWPGPLTILLPLEKGSPVSQFVTTGQNTVAVRMPAHPVARALIALSDTPLAAPSANASTRPSPTLASHVAFDLFGKIPYIIDGGACAVGVESTVVDGLSTPPMLLRPGGVSAEEIKKYGGSEWANLVIGKKNAAEFEAVKTPGMKYKHYSPSAKVVLFMNCGNGIKAVNRYLQGKEGKCALLKSIHFRSAQEIGINGAFERDLGSTPTQIARNLFRELRDVDQKGVDLILVEGIEECGEGLAVMNRLSKAATEIIDWSRSDHR